MNALKGNSSHAAKIILNQQSIIDASEHNNGFLQRMCECELLAK